MPDQPTPDQSFSIHLKSLTDFADEFTTQIESLQAPMDHLATMSDTPPQYGAFLEAWSLGAGEQAAIEEMYSLLGQVKQAIAFAGTVTGTVADGYRRADEDISSALGGTPPLGSGHFEHGGPVGFEHPWQHTDSATGQVVSPDPTSSQQGAPDPGSFTPAGPGDGAGDYSSVGHLVTDAQTAGWTPPPAAPTVTQTVTPAVTPTAASAPDPSWTDYFRGIPQGGA
jgi:hypothetical protein